MKSVFVCLCVCVFVWSVHEECVYANECMSVIYLLTPTPPQSSNLYCEQEKAVLKTYSQFLKEVISLAQRRGENFLNEY
jgi:hypothetical protein